MVEEKEEDQRKIYARDSITPRDVNSQKVTATINMCSEHVEKKGMASQPALLKRIKNPVHGMVPKYLRYNVWDPESNFTPNTAVWTEVAEPLVGPPPCVLDDDEVTKTIQENSYLFKIVTPI